MSKLYLCNATAQNWEVYFRFDFTVDDTGRKLNERNVPPKKIMLHAQQQMQFGGELFPSQVQELVSQLEANCGAVHSSEIRTAKAKGLVKMVWQLDTPIKRPVLEDVVEHNMGYLSADGAARRQRLALASNANLMHLVDTPPPSVTFEFEQMAEDPDTPADVERSFLAEGLRINQAQQPPAPKRGRPRKAA